RSRGPEDLPGDTRAHDRHDAGAREFLLEQVQETRLHRIQPYRSAQDQQLAPERCVARLTADVDADARSTRLADVRRRRDGSAKGERDGETKRRCRNPGMLRSDRTRMP